jgi:uncharacterized membrane protein YphA (DoxX/SURF4 family)
MEPVDIAFVVGRILLGGYFVVAGVAHFRNARMMSGYAASKNVPVPMAAILATGALLVAGGASIVTGILPLVGLAMIAVFLIGVTPTMHDFWRVKDPMQRVAERVNFQKNTALLGAVIALAVVPRPWTLALAP